nr:hypothetical protein [Prevotella sp.]
MKKFILALVAMVTMTVTSASAMSYEQARQQALFLTDKMAYELNLTDDQYEAAYETNLDYLMSVNTVDDLYGVYWRQRNLDLSYILLDWQYRSFLNATYFYRPLYWNAGYWHFGIYARYPHRNYYFFGRPHFYTSYCGGHSWRMNGGRSWYDGRHFGGPRPGGQPRMGMRDGFDRGDFGRGQSFGNQTRRPQMNNNRPQMNNNRPQMSNSRPQMNRSFGNRESSTRTTVNNNGSSSFGGNRGGSFGNMNRSSNSFSTPSRSSFGSSTNRTTSAPAKSFTPRSTPSNSGSFGSGSRSSFGGNRSGSSFGGGSHSGGSFGGGFHSNGGGSFGGRR